MITYNNKIMYRTMAAAHTLTIKHKKKRDVPDISPWNVPHIKEGGYLLSRIALQYHRR